MDASKTYLNSERVPVLIVQAKYYDTMVALLDVARCPACDGSGAMYDSYGEPEQCQWCYERGLVIEEANKKP